MLKEKNSLHSAYLDLMSDYENLKSRVEQEKSNAVSSEREKLLKSFFEVYLDAKQGLKYGDEGCHLIFRKLKSAFESNDTEIMDHSYFLKTKYKFDSKYACAVATTKSRTSLYIGQIDKILRDGLMDNKSKRPIVYPQVIVYE